MSTTSNDNSYTWLTGGDQAFGLMLEAIGQARSEVRFETYIFADGQPGQDFRSALVDACRRKVHVQVLVDGWGSLLLPSAFWEPLLRAGGEVRLFNPLSQGRISQRDHRKLLVCDAAQAFVGGFNIIPEQTGDGVTRGWRDLGLRISGPFAATLNASFDALWALADQRQRRLQPIGWPRKSKISFHAPATLLLSGPTVAYSSIRHALLHDFRRAAEIQIVAAYFLPVWRLRKALLRAARHGRRVQLLLAGKSDVPLARQAGRFLYSRFLRAGIEIYEYQPQILHTKLVRADSAVYVGSANLDTRSLRINHELLVRLDSAASAVAAAGIFREHLTHSRRIDPAAWRKERGLIEKLKEQLAYFVLVRLDPYFARLNLRWLR